MSITTTPLFYYGFTIGTGQIYINFNEGAGELTATLTAGNYSFTDLASHVAEKMNLVGGQTYTVTANRSDRTFTISASSNFSLLFSSGSNAGLSAAAPLGFAASDLTSTNTYTSSSSAGAEFTPQFPLQDYVGLDDYQEFAQANINESASGSVEIYSLGTRKFLEFNIGPTTNNTMRKSGGLFVNDSTAVSKLRTFMEYAITKGEIEFIPDSTDKNTFNTIILERTPTSSTGTGFKLRELYSRGLVGYFETGLLRFRERVS